MIDESGARDRAAAAFPSEAVVFGAAQELEQGWFFPCVSKRYQMLTGVIVNKASGRTLLVMMQSPIEQNLTLYDRGYQFDRYDLVVLSIHDFDRTLEIVHSLGELTLDIYYKNDRVYRVGRSLTKDEVRQRLSQLPCVFSGRFDSHIDTLENAREAGWFTFKTFEYRGK